MRVGFVAEVRLIRKIVFDVGHVFEADEARVIPVNVPVLFRKDHVPYRGGRLFE